MFDYTKTAFNKIVADLAKLSFCIAVATNAFYLAYLTYAVVFGSGPLWANIPLLALTGAYFAYFLIQTRGGKRLGTAGEVHAKKTFKSIKLLFKFFTLGVSVYGILLSVKSVSFWEIFLITLSIVGWILSVLFEVIGAIFADRFEFFKEAVSADMEEILKPVTATKNFFKKIKGEELPAEEPPSKHRLLLDEQVSAMREEKAEEKRLQKLAKKGFFKRKKKDENKR